MNLESHLPLILDLFLKSSAILLAAFGVAWLARKASAARRHLVWLAAFITLAILPLTLAIPPRWSWSWQRPAPARQTILTPLPVAIQELPDLPEEAAPVHAAWRLPGWPAIAAGAWLAGLLLLLARQAVGFWRLRGLLRRSSAITTGLAAELAAEFGAVEMHESPMCAVPLTWGWSRPVVLLPASASSWPETQLRAALAHEFGHIARRDFLWRQLAQIVRAFFWPHPLVWLAVRALHRTQEQACDDLVLQRGASPREYAMQLLDVARTLAAPMFTSSQAVAMALPSTLEGRVRAIVDEHRDRRAPGHWSRISSSAAITSVIAASAFAQVKSPPPETPATPQVLIEVKFIEVPDDAIGLSDLSRKPTVDVLLKTLTTKEGVDILSAPRITTRSGKRAMIEIADAPSPLGPRLKFEATPRILRNGPEIQVDFAATITTVDKDHQIDGKPVTTTRTVKANATLTSGETCISVSGATRKGHSLLISVTATIVDDRALIPKKSAGSHGRTIDLTIPPEVVEFEGFINHQDGTYVQVTPNVIDAEKSFDWRPVAAEKEELQPMENNPFDTISVNGINWVASDVVAADGRARMTGKALRYDAENREFAVEMTFGKKVTGWIETGKVRTKGSPKTAPGAPPPIEINAESVRHEKDMVFAEDNVVFSDGTAKIIGNALRYDPKKREVEVTGSARLERGGKVTTGERIFYWLDTGKIQAEGPSKL